MDRRYSRPDFILSKYGENVAVGAVIVGRKNNPPKYVRFNPREHFRNLLLNKKDENEMAIKFGSPLFSKLSKKYWDLDHLKECRLL